MATVTPKVKTVAFTYKMKNQKASFTPSKVKLKVGQAVSFTCAQGSLNLLLEPPSAWDPPIFKTGDPPVIVREPKGTIWCGGTFHVSNGVGTAHLDITLNPKDRKFGSQNNPPKGG